MFNIGTLAAVLIFANGAFGAGRTTFYNTGVDQNGKPLLSGQTDVHYVLAFTDPFKYTDPTHPLEGQTAAVAAAAGWLGWRGDQSGFSRWISVPSADPPAYAAPGFYQFRTTFTLTGFDLSTFVLRGRWASDNAPIGIYLNGYLVNFQDAPRYDDWTPLTIGPNSYFATNNTLDFVVQNLLTTSNPMGLRIELVGSVAKPSGPWLMGGVAVLLVVAAAALLFIFRRV
jgi:hypothetical protein